MMNYQKYKRFEPINFKERTWPDKVIEKAPTWVSVDLRDGNQALITPMKIEEKVEMFQLLVDMGFKEIEVGFPSSSQIEYDFLRILIEENLIPDDVTVQVLTQAREHLIRKTFESLKGLKRAIVHVYNSTSVLQRDVVFNKDKEEIKKIAVDGVKLVKELSKEFDGEVILEYSPESFTGTELEYAMEVCEAVMDEWGASKDKKVIINLPSTVEMTTPNVYADQIEWMSTHFKDRERVILSLHTHNDRGEGVAATELGIMAGADRVEGTLFGNGERTGNLDIVVVALNMFTQGIDPKLDLSNINNIKHVYEKVTKMQIPPRQPYAGQLVFTAFSGSHQDAINKGMHAMQERNNPIWEVPYLPIDPSDIGRQYEPIVRINSQSGKGGVAYVMESMYGFHLPKGLQVDFSKIIQDISEEEGEVSPERVYDTFIEQYVDIEEPYRFVKQRLIDISDEDSVYERRAEITIEVNGEIKELTGLGNGPIDAVKNALNSLPGQYSHLLDYSEHALTSGSSSKAAAYVYLRAKGSAKQEYGVGIHPNITTATIKAIISAMNRLHRALK
ncbi:MULTISPECIES: 2-isopropylmalate synthase [unclassified Thomasclavelia]|uniref:2-isopropylmalate synthase n=1 Tax=Candidatus Erysipelatoclostridium merdavium TaxID=2838566 RepID=A0A9D1XNK2_9FIRM|nr:MULTISPECIES: 2-isopropylmalate synthase [unclassified Thomasclavelia]OUP73506.1 2-isopropylmalate synthase [Erysipelatoclostridium sp. An173]OUQ05586.1 2-isopropylmalate synthase [Erysipelatoclostridium sp. An15]HIX82545.1 2-isopropylmalate synthase [Candidatus Erysipelatoclostridium merdavium]